MFKNTASQSWDFFAFDSTTGAPKTGDAANITISIKKDNGARAALTDTSAAEIDATNMPGWYTVDVSQTETNADKVTLAGISTTANIRVVGQLIYTTSATPAVVGSAMTLTGAYDAAKTAAQAGDSMALTSGERNSVADALLNRDMSTGSDGGSTTVRTVRQALRALRNKVSITAGTMTVTKEDDTTASWTAAITSDATADPIIAIDPAGP